MSTQMKERIMTKKRDIFAELTEGFEALKSQREGKLTLRTFKVESKPALLRTLLQRPHLRIATS